jgi:hypothetical protein
MWQDEFAASLRDGEKPPPACLQRPDGKPASRRFGIYRNNVYSSLVNTLADGFPVVARLVGDDFFKAMASHYTRQNLPLSPVMVFYGDGFGDFIDTFEPATSLPYLGDVARLEYARRLSLHAADNPSLDYDKVADFSTELLLEHTLVLHPAVLVVTSAYPIHAIWAHNALIQSRPIPTHSECVLVSRPEMSVKLTVLPPGGPEFFAAISNGHTLREAVEEILELGYRDNLDRFIRIALEAATSIHYQSKAETAGSTQRG